MELSRSSLTLVSGPVAKWTVSSAEANVGWVPVGHAIPSLARDRSRTIHTAARIPPAGGTESVSERGGLFEEVELIILWHYT